MTDGTRSKKIISRYIRKIVKQNEIETRKRKQETEDEE